MVRSNQHQAKANTLTCKCHFKYICFQIDVIRLFQTNKSKNKMGITAFIKQPKFGDVVKVYFGNGHVFGICKGITNGIVKNSCREIAIVKQTEKQYEINEVDFFLDSDKVQLT